MKRLLALFLSIVMLFSLAPLLVMASESELNPEENDEMKISESIQEDDEKDAFNEKEDSSESEDAIEKEDSFAKDGEIETPQEISPQRQENDQQIEEANTTSDDQIHSHNIEEPVEAEQRDLTNNDEVLDERSTRENGSQISEVAVRTEKEFLDAFNNPAIQVIVLTENISLKKNKRYTRVGDLTIKGTNNQKLTFQYDKSLFDKIKYSHFVVEGNFSIENMQISIEPIPTVGFSDSHDTFYVKNGHISVKNVSLNQKNNSVFIQGAVQEGIDLENFAVTSSASEVFKISNHENINLNLSGKNEFNLSSSASAFNFITPSEIITVKMNGLEGNQLIIGADKSDVSFITSNQNIELNKLNISKLWMKEPFVKIPDNAHVIAQFNWNTISNIQSFSNAASLFKGIGSIVHLNGNVMSSTEGVASFIYASNIVFWNNTIELKLNKSREAAFAQADSIDFGKMTDADIGNDITLTSREILTTPLFLFNELKLKKSKLDINTHSEEAVLKTYNENTQVPKKLIIEDNSQVNITSNSKKSLIELGATGQRAETLLKVDGPGSKLVIRENPRRGYEYISAIHFIGDAENNLNATSLESGLLIDHEAALEIHGSGQLLLSEMKNGTEYNILNGGQFLLHQDDTRDKNAFLSSTGKQIFRVSGGGIVDIQGGKVAKSTMKLSGGNNTMEVSDTGRLTIFKKGKRDIWGTKSYSVLEFSGQNNHFNAYDKGSYINLQSEQGPIIIGSGGGLTRESIPDININISEASFVARGKTGVTGDNLDNSAGIFNVKEFNFSADHPGYFDFTNRKESAPIFSKHGWLDFGSSNYFNLQNSDLSLWRKGSSNQGKPDGAWNMINVTAKGSKLNQFSNVSPGLKKFLGSSGLVDYSRIAANNLDPEVRGLHPISDTDRFIYGKVVVPDSADYSEYRDAWTEEVYVSVAEYDDQNKLVKTYPELPTMGLEDLPFDFKVYDPQGPGYIPKEEWGGHFRIDLGEGHFAPKGHRFEITEAKEKIITYESDELTQKETWKTLNISSDENCICSQTVQDKTPPEPAVIEGRLYPSHRLLKGTSTEEGNAILYDVSGNEIARTEIKKGHWELKFPDTLSLAIGDVFIVALEDTEGNVNPLNDKVWHDAYFDAATRIMVEDEVYDIQGEHVYILLDDPKLDEIQELADIQKLIKPKIIHIKENKPMALRFEALDDFPYNDKKEGRFEFRVSLEDDLSVSQIFSLNILDKDQKYESDRYVIVANNLYGGVQTYLEDERSLIQKNAVQAFSKVTGTEISVSMSKNGLLGTEGKSGIYAMTYQVNSEPSTQLDVKAYIFDYDHVEHTRKTVVMANDFYLASYAIGDTISDEEILQYSNAKGYLIDSSDENGLGIEAKVKVNQHNIEAIEGVYQAEVKVVD